MDKNIIKGNKLRNDYEVITDKFLFMTIFGKKLTAHHLDLILREVREIVEDYTTWMHYKGYLPVNHKDYHPRKWYKDMGGKEYDSSDLYRAYLKDKNKETFEQNK